LVPGCIEVSGSQLSIVKAMRPPTTFGASSEVTCHVDPIDALLHRGDLESCQVIGALDLG